MGNDRLFKDTITLAGILDFAGISPNEIYSDKDSNIMEEIINKKFEKSKSIGLGDEHYKSIVKEMAKKLRNRIVNSKESKSEQELIKLDMGQRITFDYTNWKGEFSTRSVEIGNVWYGSTEWHPEPQFLLRGFDFGKRKIRDFSIADMFNVEYLKDELEE